MNNEYDNEKFFEEYAKMSRSKEGLKAAGEWHQLKPLFPSLEGKSVLDLGCGYGWHCKFAEEQGATKILGIDLSKKMIEEAQKRNSGNQIEYRISGLEEYDYPENEWDCVISNLALHYIEDIVEIFQKVYRTLKPGGIFLFNIEHPVFTAGVGQDWIYTDDGKPQYWAIDNYFITGERNTHFLGCDVVKQHHTLTQIIMGLLNNGFELKVVEEADFLEEFDPRYNEEGVSELDEQFERLPDGHEAKRSYYLGFRQAQSEARPNIVISLLTTLQDFVDKEVSEFTSTNDFFFEELGTSKICLYVLISPLDRTWDGLVNLFFQQMFTELYFLGDKHNAKLPVPLVMLLDEFVNLGYFPTYENFLATCRGYRISVSTILQSLPQGFELYGDKKFKAIIGNHAIKICLGGVEETTAEYFSRQVNDTTIKVYTGGTSESKTSAKTTNRSGSKSESYGYQKRRLITEGEVINLQQEENGRKSIVLIDGKPYMLRKTPQFELFGNLLKKHEISQQDYISSQTEFAKETIEELEKQHKQRKVQLASAPIFHEKKQEDDLNKKEINLPEQPIESEVTEEEEEKELLMSDILSSFDEGIEENTTNDDNSELPF